MRAKILFGLAAILPIAGCQLAADEFKRQPREGELQIDARLIVTRCGVPANWVRVADKRTFILGPAPGITFEQSECLVRSVRELPYKVKVGFVGNEAYSSTES